MTGKSGLDKALIAFNLLGLLIGLGIFIFTEFISERELPYENKEFLALLQEGKNETGMQMYKLKPMILNLTSGAGRLRYLNIEMEIVPFYEQQVSLLEKMSPVIYDSIIDISGGFDPEEINSVTGRILFEDRIKKGVQRILKKVVIKKIYFTKFIIQ